MKTTKIIFALTLALIFANGFNSANAHRNLKTNIPEERKANKVAYVVRVQSSNYVKNFGTHFLIMMTDETGALVAPSQTFISGVSDYTFYENGTVRGTRIAKMMKLPIGMESFNIPANSKSGIFYGGASYLFIIQPIPAESKAVVDAH